jgi:hypothetical protein
MGDEPPTLFTTRRGMVTPFIAESARIPMAQAGGLVDFKPTSVTRHL